MRCPECAHPDSMVKDSRHIDDRKSIRRRRKCEQCGYKFSTYEAVSKHDPRTEATIRWCHISLEAITKTLGRLSTAEAR